MSSMLGSEWPEFAACKDGDPDALFVQGAEQNVAKRICRRCPVRYECLADALDNKIEYGVWGGMTERERRKLLRRMPHVPSWRSRFEVGLTGLPVALSLSEQTEDTVPAVVDELKPDSPLRPGIIATGNTALSGSVSEDVHAPMPLPEHDSIAVQ